jgi:hypothetical protein
LYSDTIGSGELAENLGFTMVLVQDVSPEQLERMGKQEVFEPSFLPRDVTWAGRKPLLRRE